MLFMVYMGYRFCLFKGFKVSFQLHEIFEQQDA